MQPDGEARAEHEEALRLLTVLPCGVLSLTDDGVVRRANPAIARMLGYVDRTLEGRHIESLLTLAGRIFYQTHLFPLLRLRGVAEEIFLLLRRQDGGEVGALVNAVRTERGGEFVIDCVVLEVRERRKYEDELLRARQAADRANAALTERTREAEEANDRLQQQALELEVQQQQMQEQAVELEARGEALQEANEATEAHARELEQARAAADAANHAKSAFLATMSHELRTPINAMIGYTQLLQFGLGGPLTDQQRGYLERLTGSSQHLLHLVNDVLDLSKIEAGEMRVAQEDATTGPPVSAALDLVRPQATARGVRLVDDRSDGHGVSFVGDEDRTRQVVLNLLGNAVKFTAAGGTISVTCDTAAATPAASASLHGAGPWVYIRVADTGIGIPPEQHDRIFDPFHQVNGGHTRQAGGTGLGLAISRRLARLMGGDLTVESTPGVGSAFTLWLPAVRRAGEAPTETPAAPSAPAEHDLTPLQTPGLGVVGDHDANSHRT